MVCAPFRSGALLLAGAVMLLCALVDARSAEPVPWSFVPPQRPELPELPAELRRWPRTPIDSFIARRLIDERLAPSPQADRLTLLRRLSFDLTGIGPTPDEIERFAADGRPDALERQVDRLLASPRYGERMAADWLDAARYADTHGYHSDSQRDMWRWRDWVTGAFNANMPYDQFTIEQLAGDLLPRPTLEQRIATGFNRNHMLNDENGAIPEEYLCEYVSDRVTTTATVWLGLTVGCARCHDHKHDPISQRDFYQLYAFFHNVPENGLGGRSGNAPPLVVAPTRLAQESLDELAAKIELLERRLAARSVDADADQAAWESQAAAKTGALNRPPQDAAVHVSLDETGPQFKGNPSLAPGKLGQALLCDGETFAELPRHSFQAGGGWERTDPLSISLWVFATTGDTGALVSSVDETLAGRGIDLSLAEEKVVFRLTHAPGNDELLARTKQKLPRSRWRHVAATYDGSGRAAGVTIYVEGQRQELEIVHDTLASHVGTDQPIRIGRGDSETFFRGMLDDVQLFSRAIAAAEVALLAGGNPIQELLAIGPDQRTLKEKEAIRRYYLEHHDETYRRLNEELALQRRKQKDLLQAAPTVMVMQELPQPRDTFILERGLYDLPGEKVAANTPAALPPLPKDAPHNRLGLAKWLVDPQHPLTGRVTANRLWQSFFGTGLVKTADDFGRHGAVPSHGELLDWLAVEFVSPKSKVQSPKSENDDHHSPLTTHHSLAWDVKKLIRRIITSATYRQSSRVTPQLLARDEDNRLLARGPRLRLSAEAIRDQALSAAGLLDQRIGGPSVRPYQPADLWKELAYDPLEYTAQTYVPSQGADLYRRSLYTFRKRTVPPPDLALLDATDREVCAVSPVRTNTPLQALVLLNDPTYVEAARHIAERALTHSSRQDERLRHLFLLVLARPPRGKETDLLLSQLAAEQKAFADHPDGARDLLSVGDSAADASLDPAELAAWTTIASVVLNLDEAITNH